MADPKAVVGKFNKFFISTCLAFAFLKGHESPSHTIIRCLEVAKTRASQTGFPPSPLIGQIRRTVASVLSRRLSAASVLPLLDAAGFVPGAINEPEVLARLSLLYAALPCFLKLIAISILFSFQRNKRGLDPI